MFHLLTDQITFFSSRSQPLVSYLTFKHGLLLEDDCLIFQHLLGKSSIFPRAHKNATLTGGGGGGDGGECLPIDNMWNLPWFLLIIWELTTPDDSSSWWKSDWCNVGRKNNLLSVWGKCPCHRWCCFPEVIWLRTKDMHTRTHARIHTHARTHRIAWLGTQNLNIGTASE